MADATFSNSRSLLFPLKLHRVLKATEKNGQDHIISWLPNGKAFQIYDKQLFAELVMPVFFGSKNYKSFQRSLNMWCFSTVVSGEHKGSCYHPFFQRGDPNLCMGMKRVRIKGNGFPRKHTNSNRKQQKNGKMGSHCSSLAKNDSCMHSTSDEGTTPAVARESLLQARPNGEGNDHQQLHAAIYKKIALERAFLLQQQRARLIDGLSALVQLTGCHTLLNMSGLACESPRGGEDSSEFFQSQAVAHGHFSPSALNLLLPNATMIAHDLNLLNLRR